MLLKIILTALCETDRMSKVKAPSTEKRLLWRSGQDELEAWVSERWL